MPSDGVRRGPLVSFTGHTSFNLVDAIKDAATRQLLSEFAILDTFLKKTGDSWKTQVIF
jgi:hypothetical protein